MFLKLERIQRQAIRFITNNYTDRKPGSISKMLKDHNIKPLQDRRKEQRLTFMFKVIQGQIPAIKQENYFTPQRQKRAIKPRNFEGYQHNNPVEKYTTNNSKCYHIPHCNTAIYGNSFFPRTITDWNKLTDNLVSSTSVDAFKAAMNSD